MFFVLSKTLGYLLLPTNFLIAHRVRRRHSDGDALCIARPQAGDIGRDAPRDLRAVATRKSCCSIPWSRASRHGTPRAVRLTASSCSGRRSKPISPLRMDTPVVRGAPDRIIAAAALARRYPNARVVFSGGSANLVSNDAREADFAGAIFESLGVDKSRLIMERRIAQHPGECRILQGAGRSRRTANDGCW